MRARTLYVLGIFICVRAPMSNFLPLYNTIFFLSSQEIFQIFFCQFFLSIVKFMRARPPSNFSFCQILINQLRSSYASCQILKQLQNQLQNNSLYLYFPFYYNTNFKINQAAKAVKFSRANLKRFKF